MRIEKFTNLYRDVTKEGTKIPQEKYCLTGQFPIVDQGQRVIAGWWNDDAGIFKNVPAIIFGDHTRAIKYMEQPFFIGADGVKILRPTNIKDNPKYLYYALQAAKIPNLGYSRHFKVVKELQICIYSRDEQNEIVRVLEKIDYLIEQRHAETTYLDQLVKSRFIELFGDPVSNSMGLPTEPMTTVCAIIDGDRGKNYPKQDEFSDTGYCLFLNAKNVTATGFSFENRMFITKEKDDALHNGKLERGDVVLTTRGTLGNLAFYDDSVPFENVRINSGMVILRMKKSVMTEVFFMEQFKLQLQSIKGKIASGSAQPQLPISTMNKIRILLAPMALQEQFAAFVEQTDKSKYYSSLSFRYCQAAANTYRQEWMTCRTSDF